MSKFKKLKLLIPKAMVIYQTELCRLADENGNLTSDGKFFLEMVLRCTNIEGYPKESEWDRLMKDPVEKKKLEELLREKLN